MTEANSWTFDGRMVAVLWRRDLLAFVRQRSRLLGALAGPALLWAAVGAGVSPAFRLQNGGDGGVGYLQYFFPGMVVLVLLQVSMTATISVIEDRRQGFLQGVLVAPGSRTALVLGKAFGATSVGLIHAALFLLLAPLAGFSPGSIEWGPLLLALALASLALTGLGFAFAWFLDSIQGYHVIMGLLLFPLWILSGAMFPATGLPPVLAVLLRWNPLSYAVAAARRALHGGTLPAGTSLPGSNPALELAVIGATAIAMLALAAVVCSRHKRASG